MPLKDVIQLEWKLCLVEGILLGSVFRRLTDPTSQQQFLLVLFLWGFSKQLLILEVNHLRPMLIIPFPYLLRPKCIDFDTLLGNGRVFPRSPQVNVFRFWLRMRAPWGLGQVSRIIRPLACSHHLNSLSYRFSMALSIFQGFKHVFHLSQESLWWSSHHSMGCNELGWEGWFPRCKWPRLYLVITF